MLKKILSAALAALIAGAGAAVAADLPKDFFWDKKKEIAVARSAAPEAVSSKATIWRLTKDGYEVAVEGENGFNCLVMRHWSAQIDTQVELFDWPELLGPICYDPLASKGPMQEQFLRAKLGLQGAGHDEIKAAVFDAYSQGKIPVLDRMAFSYMYSSEQRLTPRIGHWHPHIMVHAPYYTNDMLGGNSFTGTDPVVFEAPGTPRTIISIAVDARDGHIEPNYED